ncbi:endospore germination permease [Paenibacillus sp. RRE4]|uniref:GerAB/ArcD/ProY family transporter n=1 Tax=Paenibacillus sp. RRE4 TaxID=2962587 RepID=UPI00288209B5|nr:endospore germination permease [Paenibacillus sp. RRE4]MDT0124555.1 endospore germination permease [Paenibacillus sp. RRE4]
MIQKVTHRQMVLMLMLLSITGTLLQPHTQAIFYAEQHAYLCYIPVVLIMFTSMWMLSRVQRRFPDKDLFESLMTRFPFLGRLAGLMYIAFFFFVFARDIRLTGDYVSITLLETTPISIIVLTLLIMAIFIVRGGLGSLVGMVELYVALFLLNSIIVPFMLIQQINLDNLKPYFDVDLAGVGRGSWYLFSFYGEMIALPFVMRGSDFRVKSIFTGNIVTALLMMLIVIETITSIGVPIASRLVYPSYELARQLQISDFLDRFDLALAAATLPCIITKIAFDLYFVCWGLKRMIPKVSGKVLTGPIALLGFVCAFWFFRNAIQLNRFTREWTWVAIVFEVLFPIVFFLFLRPRKKEAGHAPNSESGERASRGKQQEAEQKQEQASGESDHAEGKTEGKSEEQSGDKSAEKSIKKKGKTSHGGGNLQPS